MSGSEGSALIAVAAVIIGIVLVVALAPEPPQGPRYMGAGSEEPQRGGTFIFHHEDEIRSMDPHIAYDELSGMAVRLLFDGLLDYDENTRLIPSLAEAMPEQSEDGKTFRFRLRRGVKFHNGRELVAEDVRWSLEHLLHPETGSPAISFYQRLVGLEAYREGAAAHIAGIDVVDRYTVELVLTEPDQTFLNAMAMTFAYPVPRENYEAHPDDVNIHPIGTGPFRLDPANWERGVRAVFDRNPEYWQPGKPYTDRMVYLENISRHVAVMRFRNGNLDAVHRFTPADYIFFKQSEAWRPYIHEAPKVNLWGLGMNTQMAPFDNVHLRRAVAFAIDSEGWSRARNGRLKVTGQPIPRQLMGYVPDLPGQHHFDMDIAREEMRLAGYPVRQEGEEFVAEGLDEEFDFWVGSGDTARFYGELVIADLAKIGLRIRIKQTTFPEYLEETGKPNRVKFFLSGWSQDFPDPANFLDVLWHSRSIRPANSNNRTYYSNPELDAILDEARVEQSTERRTVLYREASAIIIRDAPWAILWSDLSMEAWQPYVKGYKNTTVFSHDYRSVWLDEPRRRLAQGLGRFETHLAALLAPGAAR